MFSVPVCPPVSFGMFIMLGWWSLERPLKLSNVGKLCQTSQLFRVFHSQLKFYLPAKKLKKKSDFQLRNSEGAYTEWHC